VLVALGKIYCKWIKESGGIAIDIGSIFDAWAKVESRLKNPCHSIEEYNKTTSISLAEAVERYNTLCVHFGIDSARLCSPS